MGTTEQIRAYIESLAPARRSDIAALHGLILQLKPDPRLWFLDGRDENGRVVSNPSIGYGVLAKEYATGNTREFYQVGISANSTGLTVYLMGINDRAYLKDTYGPSIGKATLTGYCIKFRKLADVDLDTLKRAIRDGLQRTGRGTVQGVIGDG